jgi:catechol 2,3-dioxygenase-like lactoylglutathione lyase family enzyme
LDLPNQVPSLGTGDAKKSGGRCQECAHTLADPREWGMPEISAHATVLLVDDVARALDYYRDKLGFDVSRYEAEPEHYGYASRDSCHLHFARVDGEPPRPNGDLFDVYVYVDDVEALHAELVGRDAELLHAPVDRAYGVREIRVRDPHGYVLAFGKLLAR